MLGAHAYSLQRPKQRIVNRAAPGATFLVAMETHGVRGSDQMAGGKYRRPWFQSKKRQTASQRERLDGPRQLRRRPASAVNGPDQTTEVEAQHRLRSSRYLALETRRI